MVVERRPRGDDEIVRAHFEEGGKKGLLARFMPMGILQG